MMVVVVDGVGPPVAVLGQVGLGAGAGGGAAPLAGVDAAAGPVVAVADTALGAAAVAGPIPSERTRRLASAKKTATSIYIKLLIVITQSWAM